MCISDPTHTYNYCTQDCSSTTCPTGYLCSTNSAGTVHQCVPSGGSCANPPTDGGTGGGAGGGSGGGSGGSGPTDPNNPSDGSGSNNDQCAGCNVNNDCVAGGICVGSTNSGMTDGICEKSCDPSQTVTFAGISINFACVTQQCAADVGSLNINGALADCLVSYASCGPVDGTSASFCNPALPQCGTGSGL